MKKLVLFYIFTILSLVSYAQVTDGNSKTITIKAEESSNTQVNISPNANTGLLGTGNTKAPDLKVEENEGISMLPKEEFLSNKKQYTNRANNSIKTEGRLDLSEFKKDAYLGDIKSNSKTLTIICRDHQYVDGDRIKVTLNDTVVKYNVLLDASYKGFQIELPSGFNKIDFEALNMGSSAPNTAQLQVYDEDGKLLANEEWNLYTGYKASIVVVKE